MLVVNRKKWNESEGCHSQNKGKLKYIIQWNTKHLSLPNLKRDCFPIQRGMAWRANYTELIRKERWMVFQNKSHSNFGKNLFVCFFSVLCEFMNIIPLQSNFQINSLLSFNVIITDLIIQTEWLTLTNIYLNKSDPFWSKPDNQKMMAQFEHNVFVDKSSTASNATPQNDDLNVVWCVSAMMVTSWNRKTWWP